MERFWVRTGPRLHLGQFDLCGSLGRLYGGSGLAVDCPELVIRAARSPKLTLICDNQQVQARALSLANQFVAHYQLPGAKLVVEQTLPGHSGLGSGTQMSLAIGFALTRIYHLDPPISELACVTDRENSRSGIGVAAFEQGGFLVDGGKSLDAIENEDAGGERCIPPLLKRLDFPPGWSVLLALPHQSGGFSGQEEKDAFRRLPPMKEEDSAAICRYLLLGVLPALIEEDLPAFGRGISAIQAVVGDYFAPIQGGRFGTPLCASLAEFMTAVGLHGVGHSSWGPLIYGFCPEEEGPTLEEKVAGFLGDRGAVWLAKGNNRGAAWGWE